MKSRFDNDVRNPPELGNSCEAYQAAVEMDESGKVLKYRIENANCVLSIGEVLSLWESDGVFTEFFSSIFKHCPFDSFVWEMPPVSVNSLTEVFEFVFVKTWPSSSKPDLDTFGEFFDPNADHYGVVSFLNLGHDAKLVVPSPLKKGANYSGLPEFFSESTIEQQKALWQMTAQQLKVRLSTEKTWVSVAGGGVSWLHIRLDTRPKYYRYRPYAVR